MGFKCIVKAVSGEKFPKKDYEVAENLVDIALSREFLNIKAITNEDLKLINTTINQADIQDLQKTLNDLLVAVKSGQKEKSNSLLTTAGNIILNGSTVARNLTTVAESMKSGRAAQQFIAKVFDYVFL